MTFDQLKDARGLYEQLGPGFLSRETVDFLFNTAFGKVAPITAGTEEVTEVKTVRRKRAE